ncbi:MAG: serine/threonine protein kinase [Xanthomonadales bacterium]|nr:serine/threonine protein kinase [Xanthomonadales bacterium]
MDVERFQQIAELYHAAREASADARAALLAAAAPELRGEVESLLARSGDDTFLQQPLVASAATLLIEAPASKLVVGTLLGPYRIEERIGEGGMGQVYRAIDTRLGRAVAIKVAHARFDTRCQREARLVSALNHPGICALYDVGPDYLVMELIEGCTLAAHLARGPLPRATALAWAAQILAALAHAHDHGIVHRDLKPRNIMVVDGRIKILDFGLARSADGDSSALGGTAMGTPGYAAPEQHAGLATDARADIYSFGCVLYEMISGERVGAQRQRLQPRRLDTLIAGCLQADPARRWSSVADVQQQLDALSATRRGFGTAVVVPRGPKRTRLALAGGAAAVIALAAGGWLTRPARTLTDKDTIVLADFDNRTGEAVFDGSLRQALSVHLEQSPFLSIVGEARVQQTLALMGHAGAAGVTSPLALELCQRLGSAAVVQGSIVQVGAPYQLTLRALDCASGQALASSQAHAADKSHVLEALGIATSQLRARLGESLGTVQRFDTPLEQATTTSLDALKSYSEGMRLMATGGDANAAIALFTRATTLDADFALAHGALTIAYTNLGESRLAAESARRAYALREHVSEPEKYFISARYAKSATGDIDAAVAACHAWIQAYPRTPIPHLLLAGSIYPVIGEFDKALAEGRQAIRLAPTSAMGYVVVRNAYLTLNRLAEAQAVQAQAAALQLHSGFDALDLYAIAFLQHDQGAMERLVAAARGQGDIEHQLLALSAETAAYQGHLLQARSLSDQAADLAQRAGEREPRATYLAMSALREALLGDREEAVRRVGWALQQPPARDVLFGAALALAYAGEAAPARALAGQLAEQYPQDTLVQFNYLPALRAKLLLADGDADAALEVLRDASAYELGVTRAGVWGWTALLPVYVRGEAWLAAHEGHQAAAQFRRILDHPGIALNFPVALLARLQLARALRMSGADAAADGAYRDFLHLWRDADAGTALLAQVRTEAATRAR